MWYLDQLRHHFQFALLHQNLIFHPYNAVEHLHWIFLMIVYAVYGNSFEYTEFYPSLWLTCLKYECGISKVELALWCRMNATCIANSWRQNDTRYLCRCPTEALYAMPLEIHFRSTLLLWKPFRELPGKFPLMYLLHLCTYAFRCGIHKTSLCFIKTCGTEIAILRDN